MGNKKNNWFYIKNFKFNSLFWRDFLIIALILLVPFSIISALFYSQTTGTMKDEITLENRSKIDTAKNVIDNTLNECDLMSSYIAGNDAAQNFVLGSGYSYSIGNITSLARTIPLIYKYIDSVYIYSETTGTIYIGGSELKLNDAYDTGWLESYRAVNNPRGSIIPRYKNNSYPPIITILKPIYVADEKKGAVVMNINSDRLYRSTVAARYSKGMGFLMLDNNDVVLISNNTAQFKRNYNELGFTPTSTPFGYGSETYQQGNEKHIITFTDSNQFGFKYISTYPVSMYSDKLNGLKLNIIIIALSLLLIVFVMSYLISDKSYSPIREIVSFLETNTPDDNISTQDKNELMYIMNSIQAHIEDKEKMGEILEERMKMLKQAQYEMLQTQINPHFLYNTLETINWMAYNLSNSENPVSEALVKLAGFFRNTLSATGYLISMEEEISYTKDYISILELRYGDLFDIEWDIDPDVMECTIIKICLQPIIENAVYHGLKPKGGKGLIKICARREDDNIVFRITDDGVGMDKAALDKVNERLENEAYTAGRHIGLVNVNNRIKIIFGEKYGIRVNSEPNVGTEVVMTIPFKD